MVELSPVLWNVSTNCVCTFVLGRVYNRKGGGPVEDGIGLAHLLVQGFLSLLLLRGRSSTLRRARRNAVKKEIVHSSREGSAVLPGTWRSE